MGSVGSVVGRSFAATAVLFALGEVSCSVYDESLLGGTLTGHGGGSGGAADAGGAGAGPGTGGASAGQGGMSGGSAGAGPVPLYAYDVIDDVDLNCDNQIPKRAGRQGFWFAFNDGSGGTQVPGPGDSFQATVRPDAPGDCAVRVVGEGFSAWGFAVSLYLKHDGASRAYDASAFLGVSFWGRVGDGSAQGGSGEEPPSQAQVRVAVPDVGSVAQGEICAGATCNDHFGRTLLLSETWEHHHVSFAELTRRGWGPPDLELAIAALYEVQFITGTPGAVPVELWIDDVAFYREP